MELSRTIKVQEPAPYHTQFKLRGMPVQLRTHLSYGDIFRIQLYPAERLSQRQELILTHEHPAHGTLLDITIRFVEIVAFHRTQYIAYYTLVDQPCEGIYLALSYAEAPLTWKQTLRYYYAHYKGAVHHEDSWVIPRPGTLDPILHKHHII